MTDLIEKLRDVLTVQKLAREVPMTTALLEKIDKVCKEYLETLLP